MFRTSLKSTLKLVNRVLVLSVLLVLMSSKLRRKSRSSFRRILTLFALAVIRILFAVTSSVPVILIITRGTLFMLRRSGTFLLRTSGRRMARKKFIIFRVRLLVSLPMLLKLRKKLLSVQRASMSVKKRVRILIILVSVRVKVSPKLSYTTGRTLVNDRSTAG